MIGLLDLNSMQTVKWLIWFFFIENALEQKSTQKIIIYFWISSIGQWHDKVKYSTILIMLIGFISNTNDAHAAYDLLIYFIYKKYTFWFHQQKYKYEIWMIYSN